MRTPTPSKVPLLVPLRPKTEILMHYTPVSLEGNIDMLWARLASALARIEQLELNARDNEVLAQERYSELLVRIDCARGQ